MLDVLRKKKSNLAFFKIESIMGMRWVKCKPEYLIKWEGYSIKDNSWEPLEHLLYSLELVDEYNEQHQISINTSDYISYSKRPSYYEDKVFASRVSKSIKKIKTKYKHKKSNPKTTLSKDEAIAGLPAPIKSDNIEVAKQNQETTNQRYSIE